MTNTTHRNTIIHGDCVNILPQLDAGSVDFIPTDPPYISRYRERERKIDPKPRQLHLAQAGLRRNVPDTQMR